MATIQDITQGASYRGDPNLGGAIDMGVTISPSPLDRLATFTYYRDRDLWMKKQKDDADAANRIAMITSYDTTSPLKPYTEDLKKRVDKLKEHIRKPNALSYDKGRELFQETLDMMGDIENRRRKATANGVLYEAEKAKALSDPNAANSKAKLEILDIYVDDLFANGVEDAYNKQLSASAEIKPDDYKIGTIPTTDIYTITPLPNKDIISGKTYGDINRLDALIEQEYLNLNKGSIVDTKEYQRMSESEKKIALKQEGIRTQNKVGLDSTAVTVGNLVKELLAKTGGGIDQLTDNDLSKAGSIGGYIRLAKKYNEQVKEINAATGRTFSEIDIVDGASPTELLKLKWFGANGETLSKDIKPQIVGNDDELQRRDQDLDLLSQREGRSLQERLAKEPEVRSESILEGNALNDIEIPQDTKPGIYTMGKGIGNKKNTGNIRKLLEVKGDDGKAIPLLTDKRLESIEEDDKIQYEVEIVNGKPYVTSLIIDKIKYDRFHFRNSQLKLDTEAKGSEKSSYRQNQNYGESALKSPKNKIVVPGL